jgi:hypothetical protein
MENETLKSTESPTIPNALAPPVIRPFWLPADIDPATLDPDLDAAFRGILLPLYQRLVLQPKNPATKILGDSLCVLHALAMVESQRVGRLALEPFSGRRDDDAYDAACARYLKIIEAIERQTRLLNQQRRLESLCQMGVTMAVEPLGHDHDATEPMTFPIDEPADTEVEEDLK